MKKILFICIACMILLCGCSAAEMGKAYENQESTSIENQESTSIENQESTSIENQESTSMFVEVERAMCFKIVYHKETKVMYAVSDGRYNRGTFTLLVNADGTPMLYKDGDDK